MERSKHRGESTAAVRIFKLKLKLRKQVSVLLAVALAVVMLAVVLPGAALANGNTYYVNGTTGDNGNDCLSTTSACKTIQAAVDKASDGDTVNVAAGTYVENVTINVGLTLNGVQAGIDARTRSTSNESIIDGNGGPNITVTTSNVTIDGFTLLGPANQGTAALVMQGAYTGETFQNNIIENPGRAASFYTSNTIFRQNHVHGVGNPGDGFQENSSVASNLTFSDNLFDGAASSHADITIISGFSSTQLSHNIVVSGNTAVNDSTLIALFYTDGAQITGNSVTGANGSAVYIGGGDTNVTVSGNTITNGSATAVKVANNFGDGPNSQITITGNTLRNNAWGIYVGSNALSDVAEAHTNAIVGNSEYGVFNESSNLVDATGNWWGDASGPYYNNPSLPDACGLTTNNPQGAGNQVSPCVEFSSWLGSQESTSSLGWTDGTNVLLVNGRSHQFTFLYKSSDGSLAVCSDGDAIAFPFAGGRGGAGLVMIRATCSENHDIQIAAIGSSNGKILITLTVESGRNRRDWTTTRYVLTSDR